MIYLDNSATTKVRPEVLSAMLPFLNERFGNPSSIHEPGRLAKDALLDSRQKVAAMLGCQPEEIYFSGCGTISNNTAILGRARFVEANDLPKHMITTSIEHPSVTGPARYLESIGWDVTYLPVDSEGFVTAGSVKAALSDRTSIVSIMWANNEIGVVEPIAEIAQVVRDHSKAIGREIFMHTDAVQIPGKIAIDLSKLIVSALSLSGHKFGAPKGIGILFLRRLTNIMPIFFGGGQEMGLLPGTEALPNIVAIGEAARLAHLEQAELAARLLGYQKQLFEILSACENLRVTGPLDLSRRLPGHVSFAVADLEGEALVMRSDLQGLAVSSGSACHLGIIEPSQVLRALRLPDRLANGALRVSFGRDNSDDDAMLAGKALLEIIAKLSKHKAPSTAFSASNVSNHG
ncbi:MAG: cysteine desulfurase [Cyanobacteria bacterium REEB67]|nr:cysteine desulfurase [Cyanobacteria bacterium REEB67]